MRSRPLAAALSLAVAGLTLLAPATVAQAAGTPRPPARIALVVPITLPISTGSFVTADALATATAPSGTLARELESVYDTPVTLAIDPLLIASIRVLGSQAPPTALTWLDRLAGATNPSFALAYADSDLTAPLQAGARRSPQVQSLLFGVDPQSFAASGTDPSATASPDTPPGPTNAQLLSWNYTETGVAWPRPDAVVVDDLGALARSGYSTTLLASKNVSRSDRNSASATIDGDRVLVADEVVSGLVDRALSASDEEEWTSAAEALGAAVASYRDDSSAVLTLDRSAPIDALRLGQVLELLEAAKGTQLVPLASLSDGVAASAKLVDHPQSAGRLALVRRLLGIETGDARFASVADDPTLITGERRARLLVSLSPGASASGLAEAVQEYSDESDALRGSVHVEQSSPITLLADRASIFVSVTNDLDQAATVLVSVRPLAPLIAVENGAVEITVKAHSQSKASIPVQSLSNGTVTLLVSLRSENGVRIGEPLGVDTSVRAGWEGPVTLWLSIVVVLVFAFGLTRALVLRRRRRESRTDER